MRLGIFGGTFNPIHGGHLVLAETAREALGLDRVLFIPARQPPHKSAQGLLPGAVRLKLIELAIRDHPAFVVSDLELARRGPSYSIETVALLRRRLPRAKLFLLMGQDMLSVRWAAWDRLKRLCTIVVARRPDALPAPRRKAAQAGGRPRSERGLRWLAMPQLEISASDIRRRLRAGRSIRYLVPPAVERYIRHHKLYGRLDKYIRI